MKIWAYAKNKKDGSYILKEERPKIFYIWEALKMRTSSPHEFNNLTFISTQRDEGKRAQMSPVINGFFRYTSGSGVNKENGGDGESISHQFAIAALAQLNKANFIFGEEEVVFFFEKIFQEEDARIQFGEGKYYFPDLFVRFKDNNPFFRKWNGKAAIEITFSHQCEKEKLYDFKIHNIPIIEVVLNESMCFKPELRKEKFSHEDLEKHFNFLVGKFSEKVYAKILVDPESPLFQKEIVSDKEKEIRLLSADLLEHKEVNCELEENLRLESSKNLELQTQIELLKRDLLFIRENQKNKIIELENLKSRGLVARILNRDHE